MYYILWQKGVYNSLGNHLPECNIEFKLSGPAPYTSEGFTVDNDDHTSYRDYAALKEDTVIISQVRQAMMAAANSAVAKAASARYFCFPFFVRYAYRLYDGSVTMQSAPILMIPQTGKNPTLSMEENWPHSTSGGFILPVTVTASVNAYKLQHEAVDAQQVETLKKWSDIISSVDIFISRQFYTYNQGAADTEIIAYGDPPQKDIKEELETNHSFYFAKSIQADDIYIGTNTVPLPSNIQSSGSGGMNNRPRPSFYNQDGDVVLDFSTNNDTIVTREVMPDDYDSHDMLIPNGSYVFNARLNMTDIKKILFDGFQPKCMFACPAFSNSKSTRFVVAIEDEQKDIVVQSAQMSVKFDSSDTVPWFYYPNTKAKVLYVVTGTTIRAFPLKKHDTLMGVYYLGYYYVNSGAYHGYSNSDAVTSDSLPTISTTSEKTISIPNKIYTSEVNNPFYFPVLGINTVSTGNILGMASAVRALSQGQFGQFPLYVFTTEGVWAMEVTSTGTYSAVQPVTRDVCTNPASITSLDTAVLFATDRGIMMLSGSNSQCITDMLNDEQNNYAITQLITTANITSLTTLTSDAVTYIHFQTFIKNCKIIYDYTHQRIIVYNPDTRVNYAYSQENKGVLKSAIIQDERRYFFCDEGTVMWRAASNVEVNNYFVKKSAVTKFVRLDSVAGILAEGERLVVVIRHAERNTDSASGTPLNANGVQQAKELGGKLASNLEYHYGASGSIRTQQTCRYIAAGRAGVDTLADLSVDTLSHMGESWYVKDADAYNTATNSKGSWYVLSKWAYENSYSSAFYDFEPRCSEWIDSVAIPFSERAGTDVAFIATHDLLIMPLVAYISAKKIDIKYYDSKKWLNYLAGFAIVLKPDGSRVFYGKSVTTPCTAGRWTWTWPIWINFSWNGRWIRRKG